jgi:16S rRNA (guanine527-N7)-methyltransferase
VSRFSGVPGAHGTTELVRRLLTEAQNAGFLGPDDPERHVLQAGAFAAAAEARFGPVGPPSFLDLGSGAGVPGLFLALRWAGTEAVLLDASTRRSTFAAYAAEELGIGDRVRVCHERAEVAGRLPDYRGRFAMVVARSFGPPAVTAELAAPFLTTGGWLIVSEPPSPGSDRWPAPQLAALGLGPQAPERHGGFGVTAIQQMGPLDERFPRRVGIPSKRPLW